MVKPTTLNPARSNYRAQFETSVETRLLYQRLRTVAVGESVTYRELSEIIGQDVQGAGRSALVSARRIALRDDLALFDPIRGSGLRRLSDHENLASASAVFGKVRRAARRGVERLTAISDFAALSDADKAMHNAGVSALRVVELMSKPKSIDRLASAVNTTNAGELPVARTLEFFRGPR